MNKRKESFFSKYLKRAFDIICALITLILFSWLYLIITILVKVKLGSPIIFTQPRPGKDGKIFNLYKFRSMTDERDEDDNLLPDEKRLTKFGMFLRSSSADELCEVWNILRGEMSFVGPRPQLVRDMVFMTDEQRRRHSVRPGLTGLAQVNGRNNISWERKLEYDLKYIDSGMPLSGDVDILLKTVTTVLNRSDVEREGTASDIDFGDWLLLQGKIDRQYYDQKQNEALELLDKYECKIKENISAEG